MLMRTIMLLSAGAVLGLAGQAISQPLYAPAPGSPVSVGGGPGSIVAGDVDGDGALDLAVSNRGRGGVQVLLCDGMGRFEPMPNTAAELPGWGGGHVRLADLDHDGNLDLAVGDGGPYYRVFVLLGNGVGAFEAVAGSPFTTRDGQNPHKHGFAVVDVDEDGHLDLLTRIFQVHNIRRWYDTGEKADG